MWATNGIFQYYGSSYLLSVQIFRESANIGQSIQMKIYTAAIKNLIEN